MLDWLYLGTNVCSDQLRSDPIDHSQLFDSRIVDQEVNVWAGQINTCSTRAKYQHLCLRVDLLDDSLDAIDHLLSSRLLGSILRDKINEVKDLTV